MTTEKFVQLLKENLENESQQVILQTKLREIEGYDSMAVLTIIAMVDEHFAKKVTAQDFQKLTTVQSLIDLIGKERFED
jgi:acyl carrier protein